MVGRSDLIRPEMYMVSLGDQTVVVEGRRESYAVNGRSWSTSVLKIVTRGRINVCWVRVISNLKTTYSLEL